MSGRVIVIGASAGGVEALRTVVAGLPPDLPAPVVVVLHIPREAPSALAGILDRAGPLPAAPAEHGRTLRDGVVLVAPADHHLLLAEGLVRLSSGPTENGHRPAIDPLFRSAALAYGSRAIGVVLSGTRDDGAAGLAAIAARGGTAVVQDPAEALYAAMPANALDQVPDALVRPAAGIGALLGGLAQLTVAERRLAAAAAGGSIDDPDPTDLLASETSSAAGSGLSTAVLPAARPSPFSCPTCHGVLFELPGDPAPRLRCRVGHAWSPASLEAEQSSFVDNALWVAVRALEEKVALIDGLVAEADRRGHRHSAAGYRSRLADARAQAAAIRALLRDDDLPA